MSVVPFLMSKIAICVQVILPPLGVLTETERLNKQFWINVLLTLIGWLPGQDCSADRDRHVAATY